MKILGVIPARYESMRFPGKPLAMLGKYSMIQRVYMQSKKSQLLDYVCVATDNKEIYNHVKSFGGDVVMTGKQHQNGTSRCLEVLEKQTEIYDYVVNIQGDEPFIYPEQIDELAKLLDKKVELSTLVKKIDNSETLWSTGEAKVVLDSANYALYFSRAVIPYLNRETPKNEWHKHHEYWKHIGIYAYRSDILKEIMTLPISELESKESLEQLCWLENGFKIKVGRTSFETMTIDTKEDLEKAKLFLVNNKI